MIETRFKDTEIGRIPEDWTTSKLQTLAYDIADGPFGSNLKTEHYIQDKQVRVIQLSNIGENGWIDTNSKYTSFEHAQTISRCIVPKGSVLIAKMMPAGRSILCPCIDKEYVLGSDVIRVSFNTHINSKYFVYFCKSDSYLAQIAENTQGSTRQRTSISKVREIFVVLPPLSEQTRIASALTSVDNLISSLDKLIEKKKNIKQGTMQQLLTGKKRIKGFDEPWKMITLSDGLSFQCGAPFSSNFFNSENNGLRLIKNRDLKSDDQVYHYSGDYSESFIIRNGDLLVGMDGDFLPCLWKKGIALLNQRVGRVLSNKWDLIFLYYIMQKPLIKKQEGTGATTVKHLSHNDVESLEIYMPDNKNEQRAIASVLTSMDNEISALESKKAKYESMKQGMMQQLLTGKIRLI